MSVEEKAKTFIKEQWKAENDVIKDSVDGEIRINAYGNVEFDFFKEKANEDPRSKEVNKGDNPNDGISNIFL